MTVKVEVGFGQPPTTVSPTWTDVTAYVLTAAEVNITRGARSGERGGDPGEATFTLDNRDRRFDPSNTSGPYYGDLTPRVPVRISADLTSDVILFYGYLSGGWNLAGDDTLPIVECSVLDGFGWLAAIDAPKTAWEAEVRQLSDLRNWWRVKGDNQNLVCELTGETFTHIFSGEGSTSNPAAGAAGSIPWGAKWQQQSDTYIDLALNDLTVIVLLQVRTDQDKWGYKPHFTPWYVIGARNTQIAWGPTFANTGEDIYNHHRDGSSQPRYDEWQLFTSAGAPVSGWGSDSTNGTPVDVYDGTPHTLRVVLAVNGSDLSLDGNEPHNTDPGAAYTATSGNDDSPDRFVVGGYEHVAIADMLWGDFSELDDRTLSAAGRLGWAGDTLGERIDRLLTYSGWPQIGTVDTDTFGTTVYTGSGSLLDECRNLADADMGHFHTLRTGEIVFDCRARWWDTTNTLKLSDVPADWQATAPVVLPMAVTTSPIIYDDRILTNIVTAARQDGLPITVTDQTSVDSYGRKSDDLGEFPVVSDEQARMIAEWGLLIGGQTQRVEAATIKPAKLAGSDAVVAALELGDRVELIRTITGSGDTLTVPAHVVGISHQFTGSDWIVTLNLAGEYAAQDWGTGWGTGLWGTTLEFAP